MNVRKTVTLARSAYFSIGRRLRRADWDVAQNAAAFGKAARVHGHDCVLNAFYEGEIGEGDGMVVNISDVKPALAAAIEALDGKMLDVDVPHFAQRPATAENIVEFLWQNLPVRLANGRLARLVLELTPRTRAEISSSSEKTIMRLTRKYEFAAAHRLFAPQLSNGENDALYGKCSNPAGHGHNYGLEVTIEGTPDPETGFLIAPAELDRIVDEEVFARFDHKHLNEDCPEFVGLIPTSENFARVLFGVLQPKLQGPGRHLAKIGLHETQKNYFEVEA